MLPVRQPHRGSSLNIRKFIGATSRDALRLVREALGPDAVVLSNRTIEDGTIEIVALADSELAAIAPKKQDGAAAGTAGHPGNPGNPGNPGSPAPRAPAMQHNPYASGMPDVFSSVFGASPEAGTESMSASNVPTQPAAPASAAESAANDAAAEVNLTAAAQASATYPAQGAAPRAQPQPAAAPRVQPQAGARSSEIRTDALKAAHAAITPPTPRTMADHNPWLIDHARSIAGRQQGAYSARPSSMTPAAAMAKGLGAPVEISVPPQPASREADAPDWAREAAQLAARRAAQKAAAQGAEEARASASAAAVSEAVKTRIEEVVNETVMNELTSMRGMMEEHFAGLLWADRQRRSPARAALTKHLFAAGFSAQLVQMLVDRLPAEADSMDSGMEWVRGVLESNLPVMESEDALMERGGVFALMGPTGVGKTTTTAKLAARCVMRFGASKVALLTTDSYRIGGHEQLRIFGKILGVSVHAVKDGADLQLALSELRNKHIVLIDTIGMSQRDRLVSDQIAMLCRAGQPVRRLLLLNATSHGDTLNEVVQAYQRAPDQQPLAGCIVTKLDEATNLGGVLDTVLRYKLPVHYVSTGQKVPENLYVATRKFLIKSAFCIPRDHSPFVPQDEDIPALLAALSARSTSELHEVRFG
jgi:flagellar biosynthesis protein FlhF